MTKAELRARAAAHREDLTDPEYRTACAAIRDRIRTLPEWGANEPIHAFWPMVERREIDLRPLLRERIEAGRPTALPVVSRSDRGEPVLRHRLLRDENDLEENELGVLEPRRGSWIEPAELATVLVPALAVRTDGYRIGYGGGYYDRFLAETEAATVCPIYEASVDERFEPEPHDVPVRVIVTERRVRRPGGVRPRNLGGSAVV